AGNWVTVKRPNNKFTGTGCRFALCRVSDNCQNIFSRKKSMLNFLALVYFLIINEPFDGSIESRCHGDRVNKLNITRDILVHSRFTVLPLTEPRKENLREVILSSRNEPIVIFRVGVKYSH